MTAAGVIGPGVEVLIGVTAGFSGGPFWTRYRPAPPIITKTEDVDLLEGKVNGIQISFVEKRSYDQLNVNRIEYTGKINGDEISFTRKVLSSVRKQTLVSTAYFVAKRVKE